VTVSPPERDDEDSSLDRSPLEWAIRYAVPLSGVVGAAIYGVLRLSYALFYQPLRATPEEVGYDYVEILAGQLIGAIELTVLVWGTCFGIALLWRWVLHRLGDPLRRRSVAQASAARRPWLARRSTRTALFALLIVAVGLPVLAREKGAVAASTGETMRNIHLFGSDIPVLPVTAVPAAVQALDPALEDLEGRRCLMYLGAADGTMVFYDVLTRESLRVPSGAVLVSLQHVTGVPGACRS
jgi:hypothetical protein